MRLCRHPSWKVRCYRDYALDEPNAKFYYVSCQCGMALLDGKWQTPSKDLLEARRTNPSIPELTH